LTTEREQLDAASVLEVLAATVIFGAVIVAPWLVTPLRPSTGRQLALVLTGGCALWAGACLAARRRPAVPQWLIAAVLCVVGYGLLLTANGLRDDVLPDPALFHGGAVSWLPGAVSRSASADVLVGLVPVLIAGIAMVDLCRRPTVRHALAWGMAGTGAALASVGLAERFGLDGLRVRYDPQLGGTSFATFGYHGTAAAVLNLTLVASLLLARYHLRAGLNRFSPVATVAAVLMMGGIAATESKAGLVLGGATVALWMLPGRAMRRSGTPRRATPGRRSQRPLVVVGVAIAAAGVWSAWDRWAELGDELTTDSGRWLSWRATLHVWGRAPLSGTGPGSYKLMLPDIVRDEVPQLFRRWIVQEYETGQPVSIWMYSHHEGLQTLAEWGPLGVVLLGAIALGPLLVAVRALRRPGVERPVFVAGAIALGILNVHALVDFPLQITCVQLLAAGWGAILLADAAPHEHVACRTEREV
jgi:O-Antigen ligase